MPSVKLKFMPVGYVNPKSQRGKPGRFALDDPLNVSSYERNGKFYVVFSITRLSGMGGIPQLSYEIFNQDDTIVYRGKRSFNQAGLGTTKDRVDISTGIYHKAGEVFDTIEFEPGIATKMIHGEAVIVFNNTEISNVVTFSMDTTIGTGFERGQAYQAPAEPTVVSGVKPFEKPERVSVFQPPVTLSPKIKKIIDDWSVKKIIVPSWFANNNMNWVLEGKITEQEFLNAYANLVNTGAITSTTPQVTIAPIPEITLPSIPEVSAVMELTTTNFQVKLDNKIQFSSSLSNADYKRLQDEMSLEPKITLVFLNQTDFNPLSNFSNILRKIQNLLQGQVVETIIISPTGQVITAPEPTVAPGKTGLMGAGVLGIIGILMLGGFIADHVRKRK
jgi:hypothetical protein